MYMCIGMFYTEYNLAGEQVQTCLALTLRQPRMAFTLARSICCQSEGATLTKSSLVSLSEEGTLLHPATCELSCILLAKLSPAIGCMYHQRGSPGSTTEDALVQMFVLGSTGCRLIAFESRKYSMLILLERSAVCGF